MPLCHFYALVSALGLLSAPSSPHLRSRVSVLEWAWLAWCRPKSSTDRDWKEVWRADLKGQIRPWRAERLDNGNTLITDHQRGLVVELDPASNEVWRLAGLGRPVQALRLEDGNTLILEQERGRLVEADPVRPGLILPRITGLLGASSLTLQ